MKTVKDIIIKVANPLSFQDEDYYNQCFHVLEDVMNSFRRTRNAKENQVYTDYNVKASELSAELSRFFSLELSNTKYDKVSAELN